MIRFMKLFLFTVLAVVVVSLSSCLKNDNPKEVVYSAETEAILIDDYVAALEAAGYDNIYYYTPEGSTEGIYVIEMQEGEGLVLDSIRDAGSFIYNGASIEADSLDISIEYVGAYVSGEIFDSSAELTDGVYSYSLKDFGNYIEGWQIALGKMNKGAEGLFLIPSSLGYGSYGYYSIPPYTPLVFRMKLVDIYPGE